MSETATRFLARLKQRKLVQWAAAYVAFAFALIQGVDVVAQQFGWPEGLRRGITLALVLGFFVILVLAWYHGERGVQRVGGTELLIIALLLAIGGGLIWHFGPAVNRQAAPAIAVRSPDGATRYPGGTIPTAVSAATKAPDTTAAATVSGLHAAQAIPAKSIAVLPFENLSEDKGNAYFADGMQDLILTKLADIGDLKVISRTSTAKYASHPDDLKTIAQQLGVATILEGSVQKAGNQVLINLQLIDARTDSHIWAQSYQRTLDNIFGVEGEVAQKVADALKAKLTAAESARVASVPTTNTVAYNAFLQGEYYSQRGDSNDSKPDFLTAFDYYRQAVHADPRFALAWANLAQAQLKYFRFIGDDQPGLVADVKTNIDHAFALQPDLEQTYIARGMYLYYIKQDGAGATEAFATARRLKPQDALAVFWGGVLLQFSSQWREADTAFRQAAALDPRQWMIFEQMAVGYNSTRRYAEAERALRRALALDPSSLVVVTDLAKTYSAQGDLDAMHAVLDAAPSSVKGNPDFQQALAQYFIYRRDWTAARSALLDAQAAAPEPDWGIECKLGDVERLAGDAAKAKPYYQRCADLLPAAIRYSTDGRVGPGRLGLALVHLGQVDAALAQGRRGLANSPSVRHNRLTNMRNYAALLTMAQIQAQAGMPEAAVAILDRLLSIPDSGIVVSVSALRIDPAWDPIRKDPRFQALLKKYARPVPTSADSAGAASPGVAGVGNG